MVVPIHIGNLLNDEQYYHLHIARSSNNMLRYADADYYLKKHTIARMLVCLGLFERVETINGKDCVVITPLGHCMMRLRFYMATL